MNRKPQKPTYAALERKVKKLELRNNEWARLVATDTAMLNDLRNQLDEKTRQLAAANNSINCYREGWKAMNDIVYNVICEKKELREETKRQRAMIEAYEQMDADRAMRHIEVLEVYRCCGIGEALDNDGESAVN